ncbi:restriction endonuclease [Roseobacter sp. SK209-2-6]|uniref:restriction endonuclease n=1 Tax=Roseobacter sp. SK209-2-6 TaxID=388739 RepID=UPI003FA4C809
MDVDAVQNGPFPLLVLCECKYWQQPVPQSVVHALKVVCSDAGANQGLIISKKGFQSGAEEKPLFTNVRLKTFGQFQETYFLDWRRSCFEKICR